MSRSIDTIKRSTLGRPARALFRRLPRSVRHRLKPPPKAKPAPPPKPRPVAKPDPFTIRLPATWAVSPLGIVPESGLQKAPQAATIEVTEMLFGGRGPTPVFDVALLDALNEEYRDRPIVPNPRKFDAASRAQQASNRLNTLHRRLDFTGRRVLEIGCGDGYETWTLANHYGAEAHGVDVERRNTWADFEGSNAHYHLADIGSDSPFPDNFFDRAITFSVWEHMLHPIEALHDLYRILAPGGIAHIQAALHRGMIGSHLYRDIFFPWPHLLFDDHVVEQWYVSKGLPPKRNAWVNNLTWAHYRQEIVDLGFEVKAFQILTRPFDEEFYQRFQEPLARFGRFDLAADGFVVVVQKPMAAITPPTA